MNLSKRNTLLLLLSALIMLSFNSCRKFQGDVTVPAYLHLDRIELVPQSQNAPSADAGFYSAKIESVQLIAYFAGDPAETVIGVFQLPFTTPVLRHGTMEYLRVVPCVVQNGMVGTRIAYPYYQSITLTGVTLAPDSVTHIGFLDTATNLYTLNAHYFDRDRFHVVCSDFFEPTSFSSNLDSNVVTITNDPDNACTGIGYGLVTIPDTLTTKTFFFKNEFNIPNSTLYLEMDYQTDVEIDINMLGFLYSANGSATAKGVMRLKPNQGWNKIYINLSRTWSQFNYNTPIKVFFQAINTEGHEGHIKLDNVKVLYI